MIDILSIAEEHDLYVIEDATESLGAKINNKHTGTLGDFGCFSFNGNKLITAGGGGMIVSNDTERIEHIRYLVNQSKDGNKPGFHFEMGFNYRMTNIEAALGLAQMEKIDKFVAKKKIFRKVYQEILGDLSYVRFQEEYDNAAGSHWFTCVKIKKEIKIHDLMHELRNKGIPTRRIFMPTNKMPYLKKYAHECPVANKIYDYGICLPGSTLNKKKDIEETALMIREVLNG